MNVAVRSFARGNHSCAKLYTNNGNHISRQTGACIIKFNLTAQIEQFIVSNTTEFDRAMTRVMHSAKELTTARII